MTYGRTNALSLNYRRLAAVLSLTRQQGLRPTGSSGVTYQVQARTNLSNNSIWTNLLTITLSNDTQFIPGTVPTNRGNLFYRALAPFKTADNNYRDDRDYFRELSQSAGVLRWTGTEIEVHLVPTVNYPRSCAKSSTACCRI